MLVEVLVEIKAKQIDKTFTYSVPVNMADKIKIGARVKVPFGSRTLEGFVLKKYEKTNLEYEVKDIIDIVDFESVLNSEMINLGEYIKEKTMSTLTSVYQTMLPNALKAKEGRVIPIKKRVILKINGSLSLTLAQEKYLENFVDGILPKTEGMKISSSITNTLIKKNILVEYEEEVYRLKETVIFNDKVNELNSEQKEAVKRVVESKNIFNPFLLFGVTGSGKTEVYMHVIKSVIEDNKEVIVLVPEISLTPQIIDKFKSRFGDNIAILHSGLSDGEKYDEWRKIVRKEVKIVVGARSAIFAPFENIGAIIIDEEHSATYKQDNNPKYSAIDVAIRRCKTYNCPLLLGSATPSVESFTRAKLGIYNLLYLKNRINNNPPIIKLVDMKEELKKNNKIFSSLLISKIEEKLNKNEQVILFLNRRGYSTVLECQECGYVFKCPNCDIPLTHHRNLNKLTCHYCNHQLTKFDICPSCQSKKISHFGVGTEKIELEIKKLFPSARTLRMDVDTTSRKGSHEKIIRQFEEHEADILIGTQMISKGLDFENVTLVGVLNADASLNIPDFRSAERTFQIINQVSGRSGRSELLGEVVVQAFSIDHYSIVCAVNSNYELFYEREISLRKQLDYPPFFDLVLIKIKSSDFELGMNEGNKIVKLLGKHKVTVLGPTTGMIPKINNVYNIQIIVKCKKINEIKEDLKYINNLYINNKVQVDIEFNPLKI